MKEITIIGAGHQGLAMAAHFALNGISVNLWNRSTEHISEIQKCGYINCTGVVEGKAFINKVSSDIKDVICDTVFVTTPSTAYKNIAGIIAPYVNDNTVIFLNPGRTFGCIEFAKALSANCCTASPVIVETQSIVYTCRRDEDNSAHIFALKNNVKMAYIGNAAQDEVKSRIPLCIRENFVFAESVLETSLGNIGMILHCAPVLFNIGWIESTQHSFYYYYDGISETVGSFLEKVDRERVAVAEALDIKTLSLVEWFKECYGVEGNSIFECVQKNDNYRKIDAPNSIKHRYIDEDVPNGLVPVEALGKELGIDVSNITLIIDLACSVRNTDYRKIGRRYGIDELKEYIR